jgi:hypothetical protein
MKGKGLAAYAADLWKNQEKTIDNFFLWKELRCLGYFDSYKKLIGASILET